MKEYTAKLNYLRIAPRKVRMVADLVRDDNADAALHLLTHSTKRAAEPMEKLLRSAVKNAQNDNAELSASDLHIKELRVDQGPKLKRFRPVWRGMAHPIEKVTSHITIVLEIEEKKEPKKETSAKKATAGTAPKKKAAKTS